MALFASRKKASQDSGEKLPALVIADATGRTALAFGVTWRSLVSRDSEVAAAELARGAKASHYLFQKRQVGFTKLGADVLGVDDPPVVLAAAYVAASHYGGNALFALCLDKEQGEYWFALGRNNSPTSTDTVMKPLRVADALQQLEEMRSSLVKDDVKFDVYTNIEGVQNAKTCSLEDLFSVIVDRKGMLQPLPKRAMSIPKPVLIAGAGVAAVVAITQASGPLMGLVNKFRPKPLAVIEPVEDQAAIWRNAFQTWLNMQSGASHEGIVRARVELGSAPAETGGWMLQAAACKALPLDAAKRERQWACEARYKRAPGAALTRDVLPTLPTRWAISINPLNEFTASWSFTESKVPALDIKALHSVGEHRVETVSELQRISPVTATEPTLQFAAATIPQPTGHDGKPIAAQFAPPESQTLQVGRVILKGPLRTVDYIIGKTSLDADWTSLSLVVDKPADQGAVAPGAPIPLGVKASRIQTEISGVIYAKS